MPDCNDVAAPLSTQPIIARLLAQRPGDSPSCTERAITLPGLLALFDWDEDDPSGIASKVRPNRKIAITLDDALSAQECKALIAASEATGAFQPAGLGVAGKQQVSTSLRNSDRLITDDILLAEFLWSRVRDHVPVIFKGRRVLGLNEQLKVLRYGEGQFFKAHFDGTFVRKGTENATCLTLQFYLSDTVDGGATRFVSPLPKDLARDRAALPMGLRSVDCDALQGRALIFQHDILHEGALVRGGIKYTIRTDVEYGPPSWADSMREAVGLGCSPRRMRQCVWSMLKVVLITGCACGGIAAALAGGGSMYS